MQNNRGQLKNNSHDDNSDQIPQHYSQSAHKHYIKETPASSKLPVNHFGQRIILISFSISSFLLSFGILTAYENLRDKETIPDTGDSIVNQVNKSIDNQYPEIDQEVKDLASDLGLTDKAKEIFYDHSPKIFESGDDLGYLCNKDIQINWRIRIDGCWSAKTKKIYLLNNDNLKKTTVHEFLHAIYYDLYIQDELEDINESIDIVFNENNDELKNLIGIYNDLSNHEDHEFGGLNTYNELHSFIGSEIEEIPKSLEDHYAQFFMDRQKILSLDEDDS